jgi:hypothetical protein
VRRGHLFSPLPLNIVLKAVAREIKKENTNRLARKKSKLSSFTDDMITGMENPKESAEKAVRANKLV